ncbi:glycosyltransferase [Sphingomonas sp.]|uniref:glycosyltransferase n=1 Tax=Sphingomonas sp. TaxID=28214 RepID=UPI003CC63CEE
MVEPPGPLITVVIALRNDAKALNNTLASMVGQESVERTLVLIIDSNSLDAPIDIVHKYEDRVSIEFCTGYDSGIYNAWNKALKLVRTPWLTFFGAGDTFCEYALTKLITHIVEDPPVDIVSSRSRNIYSPTHHVIGGKPFRMEEFCRHFTVNHSGLLYRREVFNSYGNFDERYRSSGDYDFLVRIGSRVRFDFLDAIVSNYLVGGISSRSLMPIRETYQVRRRHGLASRWSNYAQFARAATAYYMSRWR